MFLHPSNTWKWSDEVRHFRVFGPTFVASWEGFDTLAKKLPTHSYHPLQICDSCVFVVSFFCISSKKKRSREDIFVVPKRSTQHRFLGVFRFCCQQKSTEAIGPRCKSIIHGTRRRRWFFLQTQLTPFEKKDGFCGEVFPSFAMETHQKKTQTRDLFNWDLSRGVLECSWKLLYVDMVSICYIYLHCTLKKSTIHYRAGKYASHFRYRSKWATTSTRTKHRSVSFHVMSFCSLHVWPFWAHIRQHSECFWWVFMSSHVSIKKETGCFKLCNITSGDYWRGIRFFSLWGLLWGRLYYPSFTSDYCATLHYGDYYSLSCESLESLLTKQSDGEFFSLLTCSYPPLTRNYATSLMMFFATKKHPETSLTNVVRCVKMFIPTSL